MFKELFNKVVSVLSPTMPKKDYNEELDLDSSDYDSEFSDGEGSNYSADKQISEVDSVVSVGFGKPEHAFPKATQLDDDEEEEEGVFIPNSSTIHEAFDTFQDVLNENEVNLRDFMSTLVSKTMSSSSSQR